MPIVPPNTVSTEINRFGDTVTLSSVTSTYSDYGDATELTSNISITAVVNELNTEDDIVKEGILLPGDKVFFCTPSTSNLVQGNKLIHDSRTYEISEVLTHRLNNTNYVYEVRAKKI